MRQDNIPCCCKNLLEPTWGWHAESAMPALLIASTRPGKKVDSQQLGISCCCRAAVACSVWLSASLCIPINQPWGSLYWLSNLWNDHMWFNFVCRRRLGWKQTVFSRKSNWQASFNQAALKKSYGSEFKGADSFKSQNLTVGCKIAFVGIRGRSCC